MSEGSGAIVAHRARATDGPAAEAGRTLWSFILLLAVYRVAHLAVRLSIADGAELDEAEQLVLGQALAWGYTAQPPLYTWLQALFFSTFGVNVLALALLKNLILFSTYLFLFLTARLTLGDGRLACLAAFSLLLIPQFAWESERDLTHSLLVTALSSATVYVLLRLLQSEHGIWYPTLACLMGLGVLSKYSFLVFVAGLLIAVASVRSLRPRLLDRRFRLAVELAILIVLPHLLWLASHHDLATGGMAKELELRAGPWSARTAAQGLWQLVWASIRFLTPLWIIVLLLFPRIVTARSPGSGGDVENRRLLGRFFLAIFGILLGAVLLLGITNIQERWMQPLLFLVPLYVFLRIKDAGADPRRIKAVASVLAVVALLSLAGRAGQVWVGPWFGVFSRLHLPFGELAEKIRADGFRRGTIVAENRLLGGNLRLSFPESRIVTPEFAGAGRASGARAGACLVVWPAPRGERVPPVLRRLMALRLNAPNPERWTPSYEEAKLKQSDERIYRLGVLLLPGGLGDCT